MLVPEKKYSERFYIENILVQNKLDLGDEIFTLDYDYDLD